MRELSFEEINDVSGALSEGDGIVATVGLMACAATAPVIAVGLVAIACYAGMSYFRSPICK